MTKTGARLNADLTAMSHRAVAENSTAKDFLVRLPLWGAWREPCTLSVEQVPITQHKDPVLEAAARATGAWIPAIEAPKAPRRRPAPEDRPELRLPIEEPPEPAQSREPEPPTPPKRGVAVVDFYV